MRAAISSLLLSASLLLPAQSQARPSPAPPDEIIIYRDRNFSGPAVAIPRDEANLRLVWKVNSVRVHGGTWQLCERPNFQGACMTVSSNMSNLGGRQVQSARMAGFAWRELGRTNVYRLGWINTVVDARNEPAMAELRLCAEQTAIRLHTARVRFANGASQILRVPSQVQSGRCTDPLALSGARRNVRSVEVTASSVGVARGRLRLEGR